MNRRPSGLTLSKALLGFLQFKAAQGLSPNTIISYEHNLRLWESRDGPFAVDEIGTERVSNFLAWLRAKYKPKRFSGNEEPLSPKSRRRNRAAVPAKRSTWINRSPNGLRDDLRPVANAQLTENLAIVPVDGIRDEKQFLRDLAVRKPLSQ